MEKEIHMQFTLTIQHLKTKRTLTDYLKDELLLPRKVRHFLRIRKHVWINDVAYPFHHLVKNGDHLTLQVSPEDYSFSPVQLGNKDQVVICYEDEHILIVDKPKGKKTHPNQPNETNTLLNDVAAYLNPFNQMPYVVHRLDKETSGLVLFAKNPVVLPILGKMLACKTISRTYQAIVTGILPKETFTINAPIGRDRHDRRKRRIDYKNGKKAITNVTVCKTQKNRSYLKIQLETGRTHQIRVHLSHIGHPLIGDPLYAPFSSFEPLQLKAIELQLIHPFTKKQLHIKSKNTLY